MSFNPGFKLPNLAHPELFPAHIWRLKLHIRTTIARYGNKQAAMRLNRHLGRRAGFTVPGRRLSRA